MQIVALLAASFAFIAQASPLDRTIDAAGAKLLQVETTGGDLVFVRDPSATSVHIKL